MIAPHDTPPTRQSADMLAHELRHGVTAAPQAVQADG
jgi:hypothetical protein